MELKSFGRLVAKALSQTSGQPLQFRLKPIRLAFKYRNAGEDETLIVRVGYGTSVVQVEQVHGEGRLGKNHVLMSELRGDPPDRMITDYIAAV